MSVERDRHAAQHRRRPLVPAVGFGFGHMPDFRCERPYAQRKQRGQNEANAAGNQRIFEKKIHSDAAR